MMTLSSYLLGLPAISCHRNKRPDLLTRLQEYFHVGAERNHFFPVIYGSMINICNRKKGAWKLRNTVNL